MTNNEFNEKRTGLANDFAAAGAALLDYMGTGGALAAIPDTQPQQYAVAGTLQLIAKLLPGDQSSTAGAAKGGITKAAFEEIAQGWDGCRYDDAMIDDIGAALRRDFDRLATTAGEQAEHAIPASINMNTQFSVTLTEYGANERNWHYAWMRDQYPDVAPAQSSAGDTITEPLWELFKIFGPHMGSGMPEVPFKGNAIVLASQAAPAAPEQVQAIPVHRATLLMIYEAMNHMGDILNGMDACEDDDEEATTPAFDAIRALLDDSPFAAPSAAAPAAPEQWISTTERMPEDGQTVLISCPEPTPEVWEAQWLAGSQTFESKASGWVRGDEASHWMPLPRPAAPPMKTATNEGDKKDGA